MDQFDELTWSAADKRRIARMFRHHVQTTWNPKGRIVRLNCAFQGGIRRGNLRVPEPPMCLGDLVDAHHVDYDRPFAVVWLCRTCHALVHRRKLEVRPFMVCDYTSLVANQLQPNRSRRRGISSPGEPTPF